MHRTRLVATIVLVSGNSLLVIAHVIHKLGPALSDRRFSLGEDGGLGELFGYAQLALAIVVLGGVVVRHATGLGVWVIVFMYMLIDDAFEIHEQAGIRIGRILGPGEPAGLEPYVVGEMILAAGVGSFFILLVVFAHRAVPVSLRRFELRFIASLGAFGVFGVVFDGLHSLVDHRLGRGLLGLVEDAGELFTMTFVAVTSIELAGFVRTRGVRPLRGAESEDSPSSAHEPSSTHETLGPSKTQA